MVSSVAILIETANYGTPMQMLQLDWSDLPDLPGEPIFSVHTVLEYSSVFLHEKWYNWVNTICSPQPQWRSLQSSCTYYLVLTGMVAMNRL